MNLLKTLTILGAKFPEYTPWDIFVQKYIKGMRSNMKYVGFSDIARILNVTDSAIFIKEIEAVRQKDFSVTAEYKDIVAVVEKYMRTQ